MQQRRQNRVQPSRRDDNFAPFPIMGEIITLFPRKINPDPAFTHGFQFILQQLRRHLRAKHGRTVFIGQNIADALPCNAQSGNCPEVVAVAQRPEFLIIINAHGSDGKQRRVGLFGKHTRHRPLRFFISAPKRNLHRADSSQLFCGGAQKLPLEFVQKAEKARLVGRSVFYRVVKPRLNQCVVFIFHKFFSYYPVDGSTAVIILRYSQLGNR